MCVGVSSCSKDDDENGNSMLVGKWVTEDGYNTMTFNADGTGVSTYGIQDVYVYDFTYKFDSKTMILTMISTHPEENEDPVETALIKIEGNKLSADGSEIVYYKQ